LTLLCFSFLVVLLLWTQHQQALSSSSSILPSEKHFGSCSFIRVLIYLF
jgi:hypothetical protein